MYITVYITADEPKVEHSFIENSILTHVILYICTQMSTTYERDKLLKHQYYLIYTATHLAIKYRSFLYCT